MITSITVDTRRCNYVTLYGRLYMLASSSLLIGRYYIVSRSSLCRRRWHFACLLQSWLMRKMHRWWWGTKHRRN